MINKEDYIEENISIDIFKENMLTLFLIIPVLAIFCIPFYFIWFTNSNIELIDVYLAFVKILNIAFIAKIMLTIIIGVIAHEVIHGLVWAMFTKRGIKSIKIGVMWQMITPYCHCYEPLKVKHYIFGTIMPGIVLGILPSILALFTGNIFILLFGNIFTLGATGDFLSAWKIRKENTDDFVLDHPSDLGCYIYRKNNIDKN